MQIRYALLSALFVTSVGYANDFPTRARVEFVLTCMSESKTSRQESMYKCSCAIDAIADKVSYDTWVDLSTVAQQHYDCGRTRRRYARLEGRAQAHCFVP